MTGGWQGNEGGGYGGGWQPPDPYQQPQYGPAYDPYGQYQQDPYAAQGFQGYDPFGPPPKKSKLPIVLSIIAIVAIVGGVVAIVLLNRNNDEQPAANTGSGSSTTSAQQTKAPGPTTSRKPTSSAARPPAPKNGWIAVEFTGGSYQVPKDWGKSAEKRDSGLGVTFADGAEFGIYDCGGSNYFRGFTATSEIQAKEGTELNLNKAVNDFANSFARKYYNSPNIDKPTETSTTVSGKRAVTVSVKLTVNPTKPDCEATSGEVAVTGVSIEKGGKLAGIRMLVVVNDLAGGPADPKPLPDPLAEEILETLVVN